MMKQFQISARQLMLIQRILTLITVEGIYTIFEANMMKLFLSTIKPLRLTQQTLISITTGEMSTPCKANMRRPAPIINGLVNWGIAQIMIGQKKMGIANKGYGIGVRPATMANKLAPMNRISNGQVAPHYTAGKHYKVYMPQARG